LTVSRPVKERDVNLLTELSCFYDYISSGYEKQKWPTDQPTQ